jgi:hypothetical protein
VTARRVAMARMRERADREPKTRDIIRRSCAEVYKV